MAEPTIVPPDLRSAIEAAAALETFDGAALAALLEQPGDAPLDRLRAAELLRPDSGLYQLVPDLQAATMQALEEMPQRLRDLDRRAARHYAGWLAAAPAAERAGVERAYMRHIERLCELLIQQQPTALAAEAAAAPLDALGDPRDRHLLRYYRGLGAGLLERYADARQEFDGLLAEHDLDDVIRARVLNSDATFARIQGDYERARDEYQLSYTIWGRLGNPIRQGMALLNQGVLNYYLQDYPAAQRDLLLSLDLFRAGEVANLEAHAALNLALVGRDQGRWGEALELCSQALAVFERAGMIEFVGYLSNNIGEIEMLRGRFDAALAQFARALDQMITRVYAVDVHLNIGLVCQAQGDDAAALEHYRAALDLALELGRHEIVALIHYRLGHAEQRIGRLDAARAGYAAAIGAIEEARTPVRDEGLLISLMGRWQLVYEAMVQLCLDRGDSAGAFDYAERARARAFADMLARRGSGLEHARVAPVTAQEAQAALPPGTLLLAYFATGLRGPESALLDAMPPEAAGLRDCLATPPRLLLLALSRAGLEAHTCSLDPNVLQASSPYLADGRRFLAPAVLRRAGAALVAPVADLIDQATRVVVVPHGPLHQLPFAALLDSAGRPLLERAPNLAYAPSATVLLRGLAPQHRQPQTPCLAVGYDGAAGLRLRHTEAEAAAIAQICGGAAWCGAPGMAAQLKDVAGDARWLHLACHGEFDLDDPLRSWLEIGPGERLSAADVLAGFALRAELVVLSACRSGVSRVLRGDEPMGLVRAFLSAGAQSVLVTLWPVEDTSARLLMERFYRAMLEQEPATDPAAALRVAQHYLRDLTLRDLRDILAGWGEDIDAIPPDSDARPYADPAFWAAYALVGG